MVTRDIYWAAQTAVIALLVLKALTGLPWQLTLAIAAIAECYLIPSRLSDAGRRPWLPLVAIAAVVVAIWLLGAWAVKADDHAGRGDGAGLIYATASIAIVMLVGAALIVWPGLLPSKPRHSVGSP
jgi:hypothetical protein